MTDNITTDRRDSACNMGTGSGVGSFGSVVGLKAETVNQIGYCEGGREGKETRIGGLV